VVQSYRYMLCGGVTWQMKKESDITVLHYTKNVIDLAQHLELIDNLSFFED